MNQENSKNEHQLTQLDASEMTQVEGGSRPTIVKDVNGNIIEIRGCIPKTTTKGQG